MLELEDKRREVIERQKEDMVGHNRILIRFCSRSIESNEPTLKQIAQTINTFDTHSDIGNTFFKRHKLKHTLWMQTQLEAM